MTMRDSGIEAVERTRKRVARSTEAETRSRLGQSFTPASVARFMASLFPPARGAGRLLDAGAGIGSLSAAFLERWRAGGFGFESLELDAFELAPALHDALAGNLAAYAAPDYPKEYAPNTRETVRRQTMHPFCDAGLARYNPDKPGRPVNNPRAVYQIAPDALVLLRTYGSPAWDDALAAYLAGCETLAARYASERAQHQVPVTIAPDRTLALSPGEHSELIRAIVEVFAPRFAPGSRLIYVGDTGEKWACFDAEALTALGVNIDAHGKMPDVILHYTEKNWLLLAESVTSHGPVDGKRHAELQTLFAGSSAGLVYVTAFPNHALLSRYLPEIAWETEVWVADAPSHLIHFNGERFLGPYNPPDRRS